MPRICISPRYLCSDKSIPDQLLRIEGIKFNCSQTGMILHHSGAYCSVLGMFLVVLRDKKASGASVVKLH